MLTLVTGASGFLGGKLVQSLVDSGHQVRAVVRQSSDCGRLENGTEIRRISLLDFQAVCEACQGVEVVFNLAGKMSKYPIRHTDLELANVHVVKTVIDACRESGVRQLIHCSTPGVVGMIGVAPECMPYQPAGPYERTKAKSEKLVRSPHTEEKLATTVIRPDFIYGPGDLHKLKMFKAIKDGRFAIIGHGRNLFHPTYIDDVVQGFMLTMGNPDAYGQIFNIAGPTPVRLSSLVATIAEELGVRPIRAKAPTAAAKLAAIGAETAYKMLRREPPLTRYQVNYFTRSHASDISKARHMLGFDPQVGMHEGIRRTIEWYRMEGLL
jgi:nucleoside-diphosphate-sugar epimerase